MELGTRTQQKTFNPSFVLRLGMVNGNGNAESVLMSADYGNMQNIRNELKAAVKALKQTRAVRVTRYLQ